jgi:hypothetical protein
VHIFFQNYILIITVASESPKRNDHLLEKQAAELNMELSWARLIHKKVQIRLDLYRDRGILDGVLTLSQFLSYI